MVLIFLVPVVLCSLPSSRTILGEWIFCSHESLSVLTFSQFFQPVEALYVLQKVKGLLLVLLIPGSVTYAQIQGLPIFFIENKNALEVLFVDLANTELL